MSFTVLSVFITLRVALYPKCLNISLHHLHSPTRTLSFSRHNSRQKAIIRIEAACSELPCFWCWPLTLGCVCASQLMSGVSGRVKLCTNTEQPIEMARVFIGIGKVQCEVTTCTLRYEVLLFCRCVWTACMCSDSDCKQVQLFPVFFYLNIVYNYVYCH